MLLILYSALPINDLNLHTSKYQFSEISICYLIISCSSAVRKLFMLYPQSNRFRQQVDLSGIWDLRFDPQNEGDKSSWQSGFGKACPVAVPASWNEQFEDGRDYLGVSWYQTTFNVPWGWASDSHNIW